MQSLVNTSDVEDLLRAELLHFKQACAAQEKRIQELESERDQGSRILPSILSPAIPPQPSLVIQNSIVPNEPAGYIDSRMVDTLRELGFLEDQARQTLSQSNNNLVVTPDILMKPLDNTTTRVRFDDSVRFDECVRLDETRLRVPVLPVQTLGHIQHTCEALSETHTMAHHRCWRLIPGELSRLVSSD